MDWNMVEANWHEFKAEVKAEWGNLTASQIESIAASRGMLATKLCEAYGMSLDEAERQIKFFEVLHRDRYPAKRAQPSLPQCSAIPQQMEQGH